MSSFGLLGGGLDDYPGPQVPVGPNEYMVYPERARRPPTMGPGRDRVLPSHEFIDRYVSNNPSVHDQIGRVQSAGLSAVNSLGFGLPMALAHRFAPETARDVQAVIDAYPSEKTVAGIGAAVANPANVGLRAAGNALASRGYGIGTQAAADAGTAAGMVVLPQIIKDGGMPHEGASVPATTAMTARVLMPTLPPSIVERALRGAQAGAFGQAPEAILHQAPERALAGGMYGAAHGAGLRPRQFDAARDKAAEALMRERYIDLLVTGGAATSALQATGYLGKKKESPASPPIDDPGYDHLAGLLAP